MNFLTFKDKLAPLVCFSVHQIFTVFPDFDRTNITRWIKNGFVVKLRQGWYSFPEFGKDMDIVRLVANRIYDPSYVSLQYALAFYGMIPETVIQVTSVSSLKTFSLQNEFGQFSYQNVKPSLMFGYTPQTILSPSANKQMFLMATPEKSLLDFLYLNPFYRTEDDFLELRLDECYMAEDLKRDLLGEYLENIKSKTLERRVHDLLRMFE